LAHALPAVAPQKLTVYVNRRTRLTLSTAACLWGLFSAYSLFFSPLLAPRIEMTPGRENAKNESDHPRLTEERRQAEQYLPGQPWAAEEKKGYHFRTDSGFFYFKNWDNQVDDGRKVRFQPFAMIWRPKGHDPNKAPYTIVSESAVVEFTSKFEITNPNPGRVIGGALEGDVQIRGADGLAVDGQQFYFGEQVQRVWSDHAVRFRHGLHSGRATGVELDLIAHPNPESTETLAITGIRTVRLRKAVDMTLMPASSTPEKPGEPVFVDCQGAFEYEVLNHIAKFEKQVHVRQPTGRGQEDRLNCETLTLVFEREETAQRAGAPPAAPPQADQNAFDSKLKFRRLLAVGPEVTVSSQRSDMQGWMTSLNYDEEARIIALSDARHVRLLQKNNELLCPEITAILDEPKKQIERVECRGSGQLYQYAKGTDQNLPTSKKARELSATWQRKMNKAPDPTTGLDLIELEGLAELKRIGGLSLEADVIGIWVTRGNGRIDRTNAGDPVDAGEDAIQPKKLLAVKDVRFASPQIGGRTESLAVWFEEGKLPPIPVVEARKISQLTRRPEPTRGAGESESEFAAGVVAPQRPLVVRGQSSSTAREMPPQNSRRQRTAAPVNRQGLAAIDDSPAGARSNRQPAQRGPAADSAAKSPTKSQARSGANTGRDAAAKVAQKPRERSGARPAAEPPAGPPAKQRDKPLAIIAESIQVRAMRDGDKTEIHEVISEGRVHVQQEHASGELPLDVTGNKLLLWNYGETNQILQVFGKPAQVQDRKMQLEGPDIRFDRIANRALVTGAGVLRVPVPNGMDGKPLPEPQILDVFWKEMMDFDGKVAKFFANVHSQLNGSDMRCEEMQVTFNRRVSFAEDSGGEQKTDIHSVVCRDGVGLNSFEYQGSILVSRRQASGFEFKLNQTTGQVTSQGPGTLELWRRGAGKGDAKRPGSRVATMRAGEVDSTGWEYTRIDFDGTMNGSTEKKMTTFREVKRVVYGAVANSTDTIDEDHLPKDGGRMKCGELTLIQVPETKTQKAYLTLKATENVELEGRSFYAKADKVTYDESKDHYILYGDGKIDATIWREPKPGASRSSQSAQWMQFIPSENKVNFDRASGGQAVR
jgi:hypothetical protein